MLLYRGSIPPHPRDLSCIWSSVAPAAEPGSALVQPLLPPDSSVAKVAEETTTEAPRTGNSCQRGLFKCKDNKGDGDKLAMNKLQLEAGRRFIFWCKRSGILRQPCNWGTL